jgi:type IV pilus assembly protein PilC
VPDYQYSGVDKAGKKVSAKLQASNEGELRMILRSQGIRPTKVGKAGLANQDLGALLKGDSMPVETLVIFTRQFQVLISSGIPIVQALDILAEQQPDKRIKGVLVTMKDRVSAGNFLWEAMSTYPKIFPRLYISLIRAGEASGAIDSIMKRLSIYLEDADRLRKTIKGAMMYPIIVTCIGIGVVSLMMVFVIPKFEELLTNAGQALPVPTAVVIAISHFMIKNIIYIVGGVVAGVFSFNKFRKSKEGSAILDRLLFRAPLFGNLMQKAGIARFARTMQTLLASGVNLIDAIDICKATIGNAVLEQAVGTIRAEVENGRTLGSVVLGLKVFPVMATQMIAVGESTGNLDNMLGKVADFYEEEVETMVNGMTKLIEPLVIVVLGGTVGGLLVAMYLPIFQIAGAV